MPIALRRRNDPAPPRADDPTLSFSHVHDAHLMAQLHQTDPANVGARFDLGHRAYVAWRNGAPAAFGWVATRTAAIGEIGATFTVPAQDRYLWNFRTLPVYRGQGIYPRLLDAIVRAEAHEAERFWIAYAPENHASGSGIRKAGFVRVGTLSFDAEGMPVVLTDGSSDGRRARQMLQVRQATGEVAPCWRCVSTGGPATDACRSGTCACDYQRPEAGC